MFLCNVSGLETYIRAYAYLISSNKFFRILGSEPAAQPAGGGYMWTSLNPNKTCLRNITKYIKLQCYNIYENVSVTEIKVFSVL